MFLGHPAGFFRDGKALFRNRFFHGFRNVRFFGGFRGFRFFGSFRGFSIFSGFGHFRLGCFRFFHKGSGFGNLLFRFRLRNFK